MDGRLEHDLLGERQLPDGVLWGIHTLRARENFRLAGRPAHRGLVHAYGLVKLACVRTSRGIGQWAKQPEIPAAIEQACQEVAQGFHDDQVSVDALAGGAGTSVNMNVNEVIAHRAQAILGTPEPRITLDDVNLHQSTNDTFPTALKVAAMTGLAALEKALVRLQESFQAKEKQFAHVVKIGRTEMQDAVLTTLGREFSAYAEAVNRDRWRVYKCNERLRVVNLGGTAIGTGLAAPRQFIFRATDELRAACGLNVARAENLVDATQNADVFVEVSGILKALASTLIKISGDLRLMSSGPEAGLAEIRLPARQAGSSIMPGKVNPVIPEAVSQAAMAVIGNDAAITFACASGSLELNPFLPLVADRLLESIDILTRSCEDLAALCVDGIEANESRCRESVHASTAVITALVAVIGYEQASELAKKAKETNLTIRQAVVAAGMMSAEEFDQLVSPEAVCRLGHQ